MVYVAQSYLACFGLYPSSCMWKTKYHNASETGSISVLMWMGQDKPTQLGPLERASLNHWTNPGLSCPIHLRTETDPVSETLALYHYIKFTGTLVCTNTEIPQELQAPSNTDVVTTRQQ
jgi:hypothetical protein